MSRRGATLLETVASLGLFSLLSLLLFAAFRSGTELWRSVDQRATGLGKLHPVQRALALDILSSSAENLDSARLPTPGNGDAVWMLSALDRNETDPRAERFKRDSSGSPEWQRNVIYYLVRPSDHDDLVGYSCNVDPDPEGDAFCPHKLLIRKIVNHPASPERLLTSAEVQAYLTSPTGFDMTSFSGESGLEEAKVLAANLLWFEAVEHSLDNRFIELDLRVASLQEATRGAAVGREPLTRFTFGQRVTLFPGIEGPP